MRSDDNGNELINRYTEGDTKLTKQKTLNKTNQVYEKGQKFELKTRIEVAFTSATNDAVSSLLSIQQKISISLRSGNAWTCTQFEYILL